MYQDEQVIKFFIDGLGIEAEKELEGVRIVRDPKTSLGKGIGFALFKSTNTRKAALSLDGRQLCGRPVRIMPVKSSKDSDRKLDSKSWQGMKSKKKATVRTQSIAFSATKLKHQGGKKERHGKRPAVAARKARQLASKN